MASDFWASALPGWGLRKRIAELRESLGEPIEPPEPPGMDDDTLLRAIKIAQGAKARGGVSPFQPTPGVQRLPISRGQTALFPTRAYQGEPEPFRPGPFPMGQVLGAIGQVAKSETIKTFGKTLARYPEGVEYLQRKAQEGSEFAIQALVEAGMRYSPEITGPFLRGMEKITPALESDFAEAVMMFPAFAPTRGFSEAARLAVTSARAVVPGAVSRFARQPVRALEAMGPARVELGIKAGMGPQGAGAIGKEVIAYGPDASKPYQMQYRLAELDDLIPSHTDAFAPNPAYPKELQPRMRERAVGRLWVQQTAKNLSPEALVGDTRMLDTGLPIVGNDLVIESGNGRVLAMRLAQQEHPEKWAAYQNALKESLPQYGFSEEALAQMRNPVIVRERLTAVDRVRFAQEANQPVVMGMSPLENALQDAGQIRLENLYIPEETINLDASLRLAGNRDFIRDFLAAIPANERGMLVDTMGDLNLMGVQRLKAAMFAHTYPGPAGKRLTQIFFESREPLLRNVEDGMMASLPKMARSEEMVRSGARQADLSIAEDLAESLDRLARLKQQKLTVPQYLAQVQMFERQLTPFQEQLLRHFDTIAKSPKAVRQFLGDYAESVIASPDVRQALMPGMERPTKEGILNAIVRRETEGPLFATAKAPEIAQPVRVAEKYGLPEAVPPIAPGVAPAEAVIPKTIEPIQGLTLRQIGERTKLKMKPVDQVLDGFGSPQEALEFADVLGKEGITYTAEGMPINAETIRAAVKAKFPKLEKVAPAAEVLAAKPPVAPKAFSIDDVIAWSREDVAAASNPLERTFRNQGLKDLLQAKKQGKKIVSVEYFRNSKTGEIEIPAKLQTPIPKAEAGIARAAPIAEAIPPVRPPVEVPPVRPPEAGVTPPARPPVEPPPRGIEIPPPITPARTLGEADDFIQKFGQYLASPESVEARNLTLALRTKVLGQRLGHLQARAQELIIQGKQSEEAIAQATKEAMSGQLPGAQTTIADDLTAEIRDAMFARIYHVLKDEPAELMSTAEALRNALLGGTIPRLPGIKGGSALTRLQRVFGENPEILKALDQPKDLKAVIEESLLGKRDWSFLEREWSVPSPIPFGQARLGEKPWPMEGLLPKMGQAKTPQEIAQEKAWLEIELAGRGPRGEVLPVKPITLETFEPQIEQALKPLALIPRTQKNILIRGLKEAGLTTVDIGNFLRAHKATLDNSWKRQNMALLLPGGAEAFWNAEVKSWQAMFNSRIALESWEGFLRYPSYAIYEDVGADFLRPLILRKGIPAYRGVEEYGFLQTQRPIPRLTAKLPWVKYPQQAFVTGVNEHLWALWERHYADMLKINEKIAAGTYKLKPGEVFNIKKEMKDYATYLGEMSGRAKLGPLRELAPALSAGLFAPRFKLGRFLSPRHLFSSNPIIRKEAWQAFALFVGSLMAIELVGERLGLWEVGLTPNSSNYGKIRIGNTWVDPWAGYQQNVRFTAQMLTGKATSPETGAEYPVERLEAAARLGRGIVAPLPSLLIDIVTGKTFEGYKLNLKNPRQWANRMAPLVADDAVEAFTESGPTIGAAVTALAIQGVSVYSLSQAAKRDRLAQQMYPGKEKYDDLSSRQQAELRRSPEGKRLEQRPMTLIQEQTEERYQRSLTYERWAEAGQDDQGNPFGKKQLRDAWSDLQIEAAGNRDTYERLRGIYERKPKNAKDEALAGYYNAIKGVENKTPPGTPVDKGAIAEALDDYVDSLTPEMQSYVLENIGINDTPTYRQFREDKRVINDTFWKPIRAFEKQNKVLEEVLNKAWIAHLNGDLRVEQGLTLRYGLKMYQRRKKELREHLRMRNQTLDGLLVKWGYYQNYAHPVNKARQKAGVAIR